MIVANHDCTARPEIPCYELGYVVRDGLEKLARQYRNSPNLKAYLSVFLQQVEQVRMALCATSLDIDNSTGDALSIIGKLIGFERCHCLPAAGCCAEMSPPELYCFDEDELYRAALKSTLIRKRNTNLVHDLQEAAVIMYGMSARVTVYCCDPNHSIHVETGRELTTDERKIMAFVAKNVLPQPFCGSIQITETTTSNPIEC